jgi:hypothetical protein
VPRSVVQKYPQNQAFPSGKPARLAALFAALGGFSACNGCGSEKPYTPFGVASALPSAALEAPPAASDSSAAPAASASSGFAVRRAELVPGAPRQWQGDNLSLITPAERGFSQVLTADFDGDQKPDAIAWLVPDKTAKNAAPGELWYFPNGAPPRELSALPDFVPNSPDCPLSVLLNQTGPHSATLDATATCKSQLIARSPTRAIVVVSPSVERPTLLTLESAAAAPGESLNFSVDSSDQDQDGRDDVRVTISVGALGSSDAANADLIFLDRAAGASRSANEPASSLLRFASRVSARARARHGEHNPDRSGNVLRLISSLCAEGGVPRVFDADGSAFHCGELTKTIDELAAADVESALIQGDLLEAFAVLGRDGWYFTKLSASAKKALERDALHAVTRFDADEAFVARTAPLLPRLPHFSPLWFETDGALLIRTDSGVTRVSADRTSESAVSAEAGAPSWPLELLGGSGVRITGASHACDRSELLLNASDAEHTILPPFVTRLLAARPASCAGHGMGPAVSIVPLGFDGSALDALIAGSHLNTNPNAPKTLEGLPALGTPRSADGRTLVTPTSYGLLLSGDRKELWRVDKLQAHASAAKFTDCVVANDARAVACVDAGRAIVFARPTKSAEPSPTASAKAKKQKKIESGAPNGVTAVWGRGPKLGGGAPLNYFSGCGGESPDD